MWEGAEVGSERWEEQTVGVLQRGRRCWQLAEGKDKYGEKMIPAAQVWTETWCLNRKVTNCIKTRKIKALNRVFWSRVGVHLSAQPQVFFDGSLGCVPLARTPAAALLRISSGSPVLATVPRFISIQALKTQSEAGTGGGQVVLAAARLIWLS